MEKSNKIYKIIQGDYWEAEINLPNKTNFEYKYLIQADNQQVWEPGENRRFVSHKEGDRLLIDNWGY